jgi:glycerate kinase
VRARGIPSTPLVACGPIGRLPAPRAAAAIGSGLLEAGLAAPDLAPLDDDARTPAQIQRLLAAARFDERLQRCRAVVIGAGPLRPRTLAGSLAFEIATRARQRGVPAYAIATSSSLGAFEERMLDLQAVELARGGSVSALAAAAARLAALV